MAQSPARTTLEGDNALWSELNNQDHEQDHVVYAAKGLDGLNIRSPFGPMPPIRLAPARVPQTLP